MVPHLHQLEAFSPGTRVVWTSPTFEQFEYEKRSDGWWEHPTLGARTSASLVGAVLVGQAARSSAGMTRMADLGWWQLPAAPSPTPVVPPPLRPLVAGLRAPTLAEVNALPPGSLIADDTDLKRPNIFAKERDGRWYDNEANDVTTYWRDPGSSCEVVLRVGPDSPYAYGISGAISADDLVSLLFERQDLRDALRERIEPLRGLADEIERIVGMKVVE
jgi:hypothetical protein